jgi:hypothetical protein
LNNFCFFRKSFSNVWRFVAVLPTAANVKL